jgi:ankyrin repeat protein
MIKNFDKYNSFLMESNGRYFNIVKGKNTPWRYRFKTEEEFNKTQERLRSTGWGCGEYYFTYFMNYLMGSDLETEFSEDKESVSIPRYNDSGIWKVTREMLVKNEPARPDYSPKKICNLDESLRDKMTPKSAEEIDNAYENIANEVADILVDHYDYDDWYNAYEWAIDHKDRIMEMIGDDGDYDLTEIVDKILYGSADMDTNTLWHDELDESIRSKMTPISMDEIKKKIKTLTKQELFRVMYEALFYDTEMFKEYLELGADINITNEWGETLLHKICYLPGWADKAETLLSLGINPNLKNKDGYTPLMVATMRQSYDTVELIINSEKFKPYMYNQIYKAIDLTKSHREDGIKKMLIDFEFEQPLYESIRDKMTPKSTEQIKKELEGKPYVYVNNALKRYNYRLDDIFSKEEQDKMDKTAFSYVDDYEEMIFVDTMKMREVLAVVGEGVDDINVYTDQYYPNDYQNEIYVTFHENAWGGISLKEWNKLDEVMKEQVKRNGIHYYEIIPESVRMIIRFDSKYPLEEI